MLLLEGLIDSFPAALVGQYHSRPWLVPASLTGLLPGLISQLGPGYVVTNNIAIHNTAVVEDGAVIKGPAIIGPGCFIAAHTYLRGGVYLGQSVVIGPGCELKSSVVLNGTHIAHFNFVGDSLIGNLVNFEAGAIICNHFNERPDKQIKLLYQSQSIQTGIEKFGAIIADSSKVGANAVLSAGTILTKNSIVNRLQLVLQNP